MPEHQIPISEVYRLLKDDLIRHERDKQRYIKWDELGNALKHKGVIEYIKKSILHLMEDYPELKDGEK